MSNILLVQSCSGSKEDTETPLSAIELYSGYFYKIIKKAQRTTGLNPDIDIVILSAKYGILNPSEKIMPYDQRMNRERAEELREQVIQDIASYVNSGDYEKIVVNAGKEYVHALQGIENHVPIEVEYISGSGIGEKGAKLKSLIRRHTVFDDLPQAEE